MSSVKKLIFHRNNSEKNNVEHKTLIYGFRAVLALVIIVIILFLFPISSVYQTASLPAEGSIAKEDLIAPFTFPVLKSEEELEQGKKLVLSNLPVILDYDPTKADSIAREIKSFFARVDSINRSNGIPESRIRSMRLVFPHLEEEGIFLLSTNEDLKIFSSNLLAILKDFYQAGMVEKVEDLPFADNRKAIILRPNAEVSVSEDELLDIFKAKERLLSLALVKFEHDQLLVKAMYEIGNRFLVPNLTQNPKEIGARRQKALDAITGQKGMVLKGEIILAKNQQVTKKDLEKLSSLSQLRIKSGLKSNPWHFVFPFL
ncbi:MAG: hypothetical protein KAW16_08365, partial [candidate division Zixibacteria bacterium]|nr:hypothetical protein [candidate division Zixibacteria bacterium]